MAGEEEQLGGRFGDYFGGGDSEVEVTPEPTPEEVAEETPESEPEEVVEEVAEPEKGKVIEFPKLEAETALKPETAPEAKPEPEKPKAPRVAPPELTAFEAGVYTILEADLEDLFASDDLEKAKSKREKLNIGAKQVAADVEKLVEKGRLKPERVTRIVERFLNNIPKVTPQFKIQAAKVKTDALLAYISEELAKEQYLQRTGKKAA